MNKSEINLNVEYLCKNMKYHLNKAAVKDRIWHEIYHSKIKNKEDPLYRLTKEFNENDYYNYKYSRKVCELSVMLGNYCMEEMFSFLVEIKRYKILKALSILGILPMWYMFELNYGKNGWPHKRRCSYINIKK